MAKSTTSFDSDNQPKKRNPRGKGKKSLMLDAIRTVCGSEDEFLQQVVGIGIGNPDKEIAPNPTLLTLVLNRVEPPLKSTSPMIKFKFTKDSSPHEQAIEVIDAMAKGEIAPDIGLMIISSITSMLKIKEVTDIDERLKLMEAHLDSQD